MQIRVMQRCERCTGGFFHHMKVALCDICEKQTREKMERSRKFQPKTRIKHLKQNNRER